MSEDKPAEKKHFIGLHSKELALITLIRELEYGTVKEIKVHRGLPDSAEVLLKRVIFGKTE